ncbi:hypothetical protein Vau01_023260 [Virgisporangium aurantiacum]|uniref:Uncharacterized protein n=1 Tax=Virgisporangium aurantiacum TaxID=175570 RepID=A0A8J3Z3W5_9ACTN|nr:hypothetical protein Vau01_023260 [Virgisporangium aurantiacum]
MWVATVAARTARWLRPTASVKATSARAGRSAARWSASLSARRANASGLAADSTTGYRIPASGSARTRAGGGSTTVRCALVPLKPKLLTAAASRPERPGRHGCGAVTGRSRPVVKSISGLAVV